MFKIAGLISANLVAVIMMRFFGLVMLYFFIIYFFWVGVYILTVWTTFSHEFKMTDKQCVLSTLLLLVFTRAIFLGTPPTLSIDSLWYLDFGKFMVQGNIPYSDFYFPYPPVFSYVIFVVMMIAPIADSFRLIAIISDVVSLVVLWKILERTSSVKRTKPVLLAYAILPMGIIESGMNGHFEPLVNLVILASVYVLLNRKYMVSGFLIGLATAIKLYPAFILIPMMIHVDNNRKRAVILLSSFVGYFIAGLPVMLNVWLLGGSTLPLYLPHVLEVQISSLMSLLSVSIAPFALIAKEHQMATGRPIIQHLREKLQLITRASWGQFTITLIGLLFFILGAHATINPFLPKNNLHYWRFPVDTSFLRGILVIIIGLLIVSTAILSGSSGEQSIQVERRFLYPAIAIMLAVIGVQFLVDYYGWYLLWVVPLILLVSDRRLFILGLTCILLVYPTYTYDNFTSLGIEEVHTWSDSLPEVVGWSSHLNLTKVNSVQHEQVPLGIRHENNRAVFWCDLSQISNSEIVQNITIKFSKNVSIPVSRESEFVMKIGCNWDPTFIDEKSALVALIGEGIFLNGTPTKFDIMGLSGSLSNLTQLHWRKYLNYLFRRNITEITKLHLEIYPQQSRVIEVYLNYMYTTFRGSSNSYSVLYAIPGVWLFVIIFKIRKIRQ